MEGNPMTRMALLLTLVAVALALPASAVAAPQGKGLVNDPFTCSNGAKVVVRSQGDSVWIGSQHYVVASFSLTSTSGGTQTQTFGQKSTRSGLVTCTRPAASGDGTFTAVLAPVPPPR